MLRTYTIYSLLFVLFFGLVYVVILGDAGFWQKSILKEKTFLLEESLRELKQENDNLRRKIQNSNLENNTQSKSSRAGTGPIIIQFDREPGARGEEQILGDQNGIGLTEVRSLYLLGSLIVFLLGLYPLNRFYEKRVSELAEG